MSISAVMSRAGYFQKYQSRKDEAKRKEDEAAWEAKCRQNDQDKATHEKLVEQLTAVQRELRAFDAEPEPVDRQHAGEDKAIADALEEVEITSDAASNAREALQNAFRKTGVTFDNIEAKEAELERVIAQELEPLLKRLDAMSEGIVTVRLASDRVASTGEAVKSAKAKAQSLRDQVDGRKRQIAAAIEERRERRGALEQRLAEVNTKLEEVNARTSRFSQEQAARRVPSRR